MGYTDGIDCIQNFENSLCDKERYNAEVNASNTCGEIYNERYYAEFDASDICYGENPSNLSIFDCSNLIGK